MSPVKVSVRVPATIANLGPGFDCLAMALDLWNQADFSLNGNDLILDVEGEGQETLPHDGNNLVAQAASYLYQSRGLQVPKGLAVHCNNSIPLGSGMGSSASATLLGLLGANALLGSPLSPREILQMAFEIEGHPDNAAAALYGGLVIVTPEEEALITRTIPVPAIRLVIVLPEVSLPTRVARAILPDKVPFKDAVLIVDTPPSWWKRCEPATWNCSVSPFRTACTNLTACPSSRVQSRHCRLLAWLEQSPPE